MMRSTAGTLISIHLLSSFYNSGSFNYAQAFHLSVPFLVSPTKVKPWHLYTATRTVRSEQGISDDDDNQNDDGDDGDNERHSLLEDGKGHINPELAQRIFRWEQQQHLNMNLRSQFSTREGLRWVQDIVSSMASASMSESDLIQEGVFELMQAMTLYEQEAKPTQSFEQFAKRRIRRVIEEFQVNGKLASSTNSRKSALSMESTVEVSDPLETHFLNQDEWEVREGLLLDNGKDLKTDALVEEFLDETLQYEGEDQMWIHQQQVAAPLRDSIPSTEEDESASRMLERDMDNDVSLDDAALRDMILYNVDELLNSTLDDMESQVIQLRFGLGFVQPKSLKEVAFDLGISVSQVRKLQKQALQKLKSSYVKHYADESDDQFNQEDSV